MKILIRLSLLILSWIFTLNIQAQPSNCIDFSEFESGASYGQPQGNVPGEIIYSNQGINLSVDQLYGFNGGGSFGQMNIENDLGFGSEFPYLQLNGITAAFELDGVANTVCFITSNNGNVINLGINGGLGTFAGIADPSIMDSFPDFDITISNFDDTPFDPIIVCISGEIEQFSLGGFGIFLDNVCTDYYPNPNCGFFGANLAPYCSSSETINLGINFNEIVGSNEFVDIFLDDELYGFFAIESFPLTLENIPLDENQSIVEFRICINDQPDCCYTASLDLPDCTPEGCVGFELYSDEMAAAFANDWPYDSVYHVENGIRFTQRQMYREGQLLPANGIMLRLAPNAVPEFTTGSFITMGHVGTASQIDLTGYSEPIYSVSFDFYRFDDESYMNIGVNGQEVAEPNGSFQGGAGTTTLADGTVQRISFSALDPNLGTIEFFGNDITEIFFGGEGVTMDNLCFNQTVCEITNLTAGQFACEGNNDLPAHFFLDFDHNSLAQDSFVLQIGPEGPFSTFTYAYGDLPLTNILINGTLGQVFDFTVTDQFFEDCSASVTAELHNCENACADFTASITDVYCTDPFSYEVVVEMSTVAANQIVLLRGLSNNITQTALLTNGNSVTFSFSEGENDPEGYTLTDGLSACEVYIPPFEEPLECMECIIEQASITPTPCNEDGFYSVVVEVIGSNVLQDYYINISDNQTFGPFQAEDFPVTVGELQGGSDIIYFVEVYGVGGDCFYGEDIFQNCDNNCDEIFSQPTISCSADGAPVIYFTAINPNGGTFNITINGVTFIREYGETEYAIAAPNTPGQNVFEIILQDNNSGCANGYVLDNPCSCDNFFPNILAVECTPDTVLLTIFLEAAEPDLRELRFSDANGNPFTEVIFTQNPFIVALPPSVSPSGVLLIEDITNGCERFLQYDIPPGCTNNCENIFGLLDVNCNDFNEIRIFFTAEGPAESTFFVNINDQTFIREYGAGEYVIELPSDPNQQFYTINFWDELTGCEAIFEFEDPCSTTCEGFNPEIIAVECTPDAILLSILLDGEEPDFRELRFTDLDGNFITEVLFSQNPFIIAFPPANSNLGTILIEDTTNGCEQVLQYEVPTDCFDECDGLFTLLEVDCNASGEIRVFFTTNGPEGAPFFVDVEDESYFFEHGQEQYVIELIPNPNQANYTINFFDEFSGCEAFFTFDNPCETCDNFYPFIISAECTSSDTLIHLTILLDGSEADEREIHIRSINGELYQELLFVQNPFTVSVPLSNPGVIFIEDVTNGCEQALQYDIPEDCLTNCEDFSADWVAFNCLESAFIELYFDIAGIEPNGQILQVESLTTGYTVEVSYTESALQVEWPLLDQGEIRITTSDGCSDVTPFTTPELCIHDCIGSFELLDVSCNNTEEIRISFLANGSEGAAFTINANGIPFTRFFGEEEYVIEIPSINGQNEYELIFQDQLSGCVDVINITNPCFCVIENVSYSIIECNEVGEWFLELSFFGGSTSDEDQFIVSAGGYTQAFPQGTVNTTIGPFTNNFNDPITLEISAISGNCEESIVIDYACEPQFCDITNVIVTGSSCDNAGNYFLDVYFEAEGAEIFEVSVTNADLSTIVIGSGQTTTFGPLNINEIQTSIILVEAIDANCAAEYLYIQECEPFGECNFTNVFAEAYDCDGELFLVDIAFDNPNGGDLGFYIFGDGMIFGPYDYGQTFYTFGPLNGAESAHDILILDIANPACFTNYSLNYSCSEECLIEEVVLTPSACNDDGTFFVTIDVEGNNLGENFSVLGNGQNYGTFSYANLPVEVGPFDGDNETVYELGIIDLNNPNCAEWSTFGPVNCTPCDIRDFTYEIDCDNNGLGYTLTIDFIYDNPTSEFFALQIGGELYEWFPYESLPLTLNNIPYEFNGDIIRVEDSQEESCGETIDFNLPCCSMGNVLNELEVEACEENGEYYLSIHNFNGQNLSDSLVVDYAPAGASIIATVVIAYNDLPAQIGPLVGDGNTGYLVVLSDQENDCSVTTNIEPVFCDNSTCIEFEGENGVFGPNFDYDSGDLITTENEVAITFERNPVTNCECNLFITNGIPGIDFGNGQIVATLNSGFGLNFTEVTQTFNTVNIDFYYPGGGFSLIVNGSDLITVDNLNDLPNSIAGVELQVITDPNNPSIGLFTFNGEIESIQLFSDESAAFDNVCMSTDDNVWPGDTNTDNIASHFDLLNIGLTYGNTGPSRQEIADVWAGLISADWAGNFADGVNHKHADANGDGVVNEEDRLVLVDNYGLDHGPASEFVALPYTDLDPPIHVDVSDIDDAGPGSNIQIPVIAGSIDQEIQDIYGLAFTIQLDPELFDMSSIQVIYPTSWFGEPGVNTSSIERIYEDGRIEVAMTRIDHNNVSGFGEVMYIRVIIDDIAGLVNVPTDIVLEDILAINHNEDRSVLRPEMAQLMITGTTEEMDRDLLRSSFRIFPNPTQGLLHFRNQYAIAPDRVTITDAAGRLIGNIKTPGMTVDLSRYPAGVYFLQVHLQGYIFTERVVKTE